MHFDWTVTVGDIAIVFGGAFTMISSTVVLLYRICQRLDRIEAMSLVAARRSQNIDTQAAAAIGAAVGATTVKSITGMGEKTD